MEYNNFFIGLFGIILGGVITYCGQIFHTQYLDKKQNRLDLKYLLLELKRTTVAIQSMYLQSNEEESPWTCR